MRSTIAAVFALIAIGCSANEPGFDHLRYTEVSLAPVSAQLQSTEITLTEGIVVKARVQAIDEAGDSMGGRLALESLAPNVLEVLPGPEGAWVFVGASSGETAVSVLIDGRRVGEVSGRVLAQP